MKITEIPAKEAEQKIIRVAAYARVSSDKDAAFHSLEAQTEYYEDYVAAHPDWELVSIYSDNGISGTIINRPEFQRMLEDCRAGRVDLIITKSVTRFARNTVILLETVRELKKLGVDCYFEKEDMHSISPDGELLLTLLAMYAEEEARSASENQKWRIKKKFENGVPWNAYMLGYRLVGNKFEIVPEEAEIVRRIFALYLSGMGTGRIARQLMQEQLYPLRTDHWSKNSIKQILQNEKYTGNMLLQKTYRDDFRTKRRKVNRGVVRQYWIEDSHEVIIDTETFEAVQREMERRKQKSRADIPAGSNGKQSLFSGLIFCGFCKKHYIRRYNNKGQYKRPVWVCGGYDFLGKDFCPSQKIPEDILIQKTKEVLETEELTRESLCQQIAQIIVPEHHRIIYCLRDGREMDVRWQHRSRAESWTPEMRQKARERTLERYRKEQAKNAESDNH